MEFRKWIEEEEGLMAMSRRNLSPEDLSDLRKKRGRCGLCFPYALSLAGEAMSDGVYAPDDILVVHGETQSGPNWAGGDHAWVEMGGIAYDWQTKHNKEKPPTIEEFYKKHNPKNVKKYPASKAIGMSVMKQNYGPWHDPSWKV